jgi:acetoin utilization protein AcuB
MWMTPKVISIFPEEPLGKAASLMAEHGIRRLPVLEPAPRGPGRLVGILTHGDVLHAAPAVVDPFAAGGPGALPAGVRVSEVMHSPVITTGPDAPIEQVAELMRTHKIGSLPVVEYDHVVGMISESDILRAFVSLFTVPGELTRITFQVDLNEEAFSFVSDIASRNGLSVHGLMSSVIEGRPVYVLWVAGTGVERLQQELWAGGHQVLSVLRV